jgi:hypothetical protein
VGGLALSAAVVGALALSAAGCGSESEDATEAAREELLRDLDSCEPEIVPVQVTCGAAIAMRLIMVDVSGPQRTESGRYGGWVCTDLPPAREPLLTVCRQGRKFFTFEARD